ncbi:MAG TPA: DUF1553 domain-containing protein, partial [Verrucomicrobia bacterium]|nr:DUF1553 domain-containing protein [Verrucomicrobiota bacterium]
LEEGRLSASLIHFWPGNAIRIRTAEAAPTQEWIHVTMTYDGSSKAAGLSLYLNGVEADSVVVRDHLIKNITGSGGDHITIGERFRDRGFKKGRVDEFMVFDRELTAIEVVALKDEHDLNEFLDSEIHRSSSGQKRLLEYYLNRVDAEVSAQKETVRQKRKELFEYTDGRNEIMVMQELEAPRSTYLLNRGAYDAPTGEPLQPGTPAFLSPFPEDQPRNRLGLAKWLTDSRNPLTTRVVVNRFWQMLFGRGLVGTPEDFGSQGEVPEYLDLVDWLAQEFIRLQWDTKALIKTMVMSHTYRQSSDADPALIERDPQNRMLSRGPRFRLTAEMLRDNALAVSGLLVERIGGPSVKPYEVQVSFKPMKPDDGEGLYRRSLYTYWKRTGPAPVMMAFDASKRDVCSVRRERTSTPLQALVLLNDPQMTEAARVLAESLYLKHSEDKDSLIREVFLLLTSREVTRQESSILRQLLIEQADYFRKHPDRVASFLNIGHTKSEQSSLNEQVAATTVLVQTLMNFDECVIKR